MICDIYDQPILQVILKLSNKYDESMLIRSIVNNNLV